MTAPAAVKEEPVGLAQLAQVVALATLTLLWMDRHLGFGLRGWGPLAGLVLASGVGWRFVQAFAADAAAQATTRAGRAARTVFSRRVRVAWAAALLFVMAFFSSVTLVSSSSAPVPARLEPVGERTKAVWGPTDEKETTRWVVRTSPFGMLYNLAAKGQLRETLEVFPVLGRQVRQRDLRQEPTVLLRPGVEGLKALEHGRLDVWQDREGGRRVAELAAKRGAVLLGTRQPIPPAWIEDWTLELRSLVPAPEPAAEVLRTWRRPIVVAPAFGLEPGMVLVAQIRNKTHHLIASETITLGAETPADVFLADDVKE